MAFLNSLDITGSALTAERYRTDVVLQNLANMNTTRTADGKPYRRKQVIFQERPLRFAETLQNAQESRKSAGVRVEDVVESQRDFKRVYDPNHPDADAEGYVLYPNVDATEERLDLIAAANAFTANLTALNVTKNMIIKATEIGK